MSENALNGTSFKGFEFDSGGVLRVEAFQQFPWLQSGFGTRLNESWPANPIRVRQVHSDRVLKVDAAWQGEPPEADALISDHPGLLLGIRTADCLPILIVDERNRAVAAIHAGWRGTVAEIALRTIEALNRNYGSRSEDLRVAIGPGIGNCCFEVGPEVSHHFQKFFPEEPMSGQRHIDIAETNQRQFVRAGVVPERIDTFPGCTKCRGDLFHSWRRDGLSSGRMTAAIGIADPPQIK